MCNKSETISKLAVALVKFNSEVKIIEKDSSNPHFKNKYASLDNIIDEVRPLLAKHGLSVLQFPGGDGEKFTLRSMLLHESGEWIESEPITMRPVKNDPQGIGSCATYARRYSISALLSLNTGEDDDGNGASQAGNPQKQYTPQTSGSTSTVKAKYQLWHGSMDGYESWYGSQKEKFNDKQIEHWLTTQINKKPVGAH